MGPIPVIDLMPSPRGLPGARRPKPSLPYCFFPFSPFLPNLQTSFEALDERAEVNDVSFSSNSSSTYRRSTRHKCAEALINVSVFIGCAHFEEYVRAGGM